MNLGHALKPLTQKQKQISACIKYFRHVYVIGGKRSGKSTGGAFGVAKYIYRWSPGANALAVAPTFPQLKDLFLEKWQKVVPPHLYEINTYGTKDAGPHILCYHPQEKGPPKTSFIYLRTEKAFKRIEGLTVGLGYCEEVQDCPQAWSLMDDRISDAEAKHLVRVGVGIPESGWLEEEFEGFPDGQYDPKTKGAWIHCESDDNKEYLPKGYSEERLETLSPNEYRQRIKGLFVPATDAIYPVFARAVHLRPWQFKWGVKVWCGKDFNINPQTAVFFQEWEGNLYAFDESVATGSTQDHGELIAKWCEEKRINYRDSNLFEIIPDATGKKRGSETFDLRSNHDVLKRLGFSLNVPTHNPYIEDRDASVTWLLRSAGGSTRLFFDPRCKGTIKSMGSLKATGRDRSPWSHLTDCVGYVICRLYPVREPAALVLPITAGRQSTQDVNPIPFENPRDPGF